MFYTCIKTRWIYSNRYFQKKNVSCNDSLPCNLPLSITCSTKVDHSGAQTNVSGNLANSWSICTANLGIEIDAEAWIQTFLGSKFKSCDTCHCLSSHRKMAGDTSQPSTNYACDFLIDKVFV